jgi:hypothetical protein
MAIEPVAVAAPASVSVAGSLRTAINTFQCV